MTGLDQLVRAGVPTGPSSGTSQYPGCTLIPTRPAAMVPNSHMSKSCHLSAHMQWASGHPARLAPWLQCINGAGGGADGQNGSEESSAGSGGKAGDGDDGGCMLPPPPPSQSLRTVHRALLVSPSASLAAARPGCRTGNTCAPCWNCRGWTARYGTVRRLSVFCWKARASGSSERGTDDDGQKPAVRVSQVSSTDTACFLVCGKAYR